MVDGDKQRIRPDHDRSSVRPVAFRRCLGGGPLHGLPVPASNLVRRYFVAVPWLLLHLANRDLDHSSELDVTRYILDHNNHPSSSSSS